MKAFSDKHFKRLLLSLVVLIIGAISVYLHQINNRSLDQSQVNGLNKASSAKVFTPDWGVGATMVAMGQLPIAMGDKRIYPVWVNTPVLPESIIDAGIRSQPNVELLAQLQLDFIFNTFFYDSNRMFYDPSIPVYEIDFGFKDNTTNAIPKWSRYTEPTQNIGMKLNNLSQADQYIKDSKQRIIDAGKTVHQYIGDDKRLLVIDFWDARQINATTLNSPISLAVKMMGYETVSVGKGSIWGNATLPMHTLYELPDDVCLIISEPIPEMTKYDIAHSPVWQRSPFFAPDACIYKIDPVWTNGGLEVLVSFAENLEKAVTTQSKNEFSYTFVKEGSK